MISAVVAEFQLEGLPSERNSGELMSQADSENRLPSHQAPNVVDGIRAGVGIARAIREEHAVGLQGEHVLRCRTRRLDCHLTTFSEQFAQCIRLDADW